MKRRAANKRGGPVSFTTLRMRDLGRLFRDRYRGWVLPNDDAGLDDLRIMLNELTRTTDPPRFMRNCIEVWAPWMSEIDTVAEIERAIAKPRKRRADTLAERLNLHFAERQRLGITTIGATDKSKKQREAERQARKLARQKQRRRTRGVRPRDQYEAQSANKTQPWKALGIGKTKWYALERAKRAQAAEGERTSVKPTLAAL
jgi:hypothetical protein